MDVPAREIFVSPSHQDIWLEKHVNKSCIFFNFQYYYGHSPLQFVLYVGMENYCISIPVKHQSLYWCVCASNHSVVPKWDQIVFLSTNHTVTQWRFQPINNCKRVIQDIFQIHLNIRTLPIILPIKESIILNFTSFWVVLRTIWPLFSGWLPCGCLILLENRNSGCVWI